MKYRWTILPCERELAAQLAANAGVPLLLAQCLMNRQVCDPGAASAFLEPRLRNLTDPFLLPNMEAAVARLFAARDRKEPLVIFGDYDVDGVTSTALLLEVLGNLGWTVHAYLPHRLDEGYGLTPDGVENCLQQFPVPLLVAVDCGSTSAEVIASLRARGVDTVVLDHHQVSTPPPEAVALVNPQLLTHSALPPLAGAAALSSLCSAGLAFKLAHALVKRGRESGDPAALAFDLRPLLDLVALGTIADLVPLRGENRILVSAGLERLNQTRRPGLVALKTVAACPEKLGCFEVSFQLAPRLNAAGRLETAETSLRLLLARDLPEAMPLARALDTRNRERQNLERTTSTEVLGRVRDRFNPDEHFVIVEGHPSWHVGVVGIVASRILGQFYRPTIILGGDGAEWRGSGRSIAGFDLAAALRECSDLLVRHGGHAMAAGVSLASENIDRFRERLNEVARKQLSKEFLLPSLNLDAEVKLAEITLASLATLDRLHPTGQANPAVQLCARRLSHGRPPQRFGADKQHVRLWALDDTGTREVVWWRAGESELPAGTFDLAFAPEVNHYNGTSTPRLKLLDWRPSA
jgi:single-stranded-DNA-specific exonuclease